MSVDGAMASALLAALDDEFDTAARRVLERNRELCRRLPGWHYLSLGEVLRLRQRDGYVPDAARSGGCSNSR